MPAATAAILEPTTRKQKARSSDILKAAKRAFAERPFHEVLMDDIARDSSVGKGTLYRYYASKESLYFAVIFDGIDDLQLRIRSRFKECKGTEQTIADLISTLVSFFSRNRIFFRLMNIEDSKVGGMETPNRRRWEGKRAELVGAIAEVFERSGEEDSLEIVYPRTEAQILQGMVRSVLRHNDDKLTVKEMSERITRIFLCGVGKRGYGEGR